MTRTGGSRGSPRIHHDGPESFPLTADNDADSRQQPRTRNLQQQPAAIGLDATRLRRLSFGGRGAANKNILPALDRPRAVPAGPLAPLPAEKPKFHHGDARPKLPKRQKPPKRGKRGKRQSIGDEDFGQSALLDDELRGNVNARTIAAASMEMARSRPNQQGRQQRDDGGNQETDEDSRLCRELLLKAPHGHDDASKYWSRALRVYAAQSHPEEFALIQLKLAQSFYATAMLGTVTKNVLKCLDSCLSHYNICLQLYNPSRYPRRWGLAALEMGMALGLMADLVEREIPRVKPDAKAGTDAVAGFYKEVGIMTQKASDYRQRSLDNIESASEVLKGNANTEERAKAQVEYARGILRRLTGDLGENRELAVFNLERAIQDYELLIDDESLKNESPDSPSGCIDRGPAHAYQLPVRVANREPAHDDAAGYGVVSKPSGNPSSYDAEAEERLPMRLRGVKAAYGRALGTAGKLCLDKHASTVGGHPESAAQACDHLTKAAEVIPDDTRDRAEALLLLARATIEKCVVAEPIGHAGRRGMSRSEALETGIGHLRAALETCPQKQLALRQEVHWNLGRLALARLQGRLRSDSVVDDKPFGSSSGRTPLVYLAREAGKHLVEAISLAQAAMEVAAAAAAAEARPKRAENGAAGAVDAGSDDDGMRAREGWARMELSKLCLTEVAPDYHVAAAIEHLSLSREIYPLDAAPAEYITCTCLLARAFHQAGESEKSVQAYRDASRAAPLLGNQLHHAHLDLNPGAIIPRTEGGQRGADGANVLASPRPQPFRLNGGVGEAAILMPSLSGELRGLFAGGIARCFDRCRAEAARASVARYPGVGGVASEASFRTGGGSSVTSGAAAARSSSKVKRSAEWTWIPDQDGTPDNPRANPPGSISIDRKESITGSAGAATAAKATSPEQADQPYSAEDLARWKPGPLKELLAGLGLDASGCTEKNDIVEKIMRHPGGPVAAADAATARGETVAFPGRGEQSPAQEGSITQSTQAVEEAAVAATAEDREEEEGFVGMTLADYMGRPTGEDGGGDTDFGGGGGGGGGGRPSGGGAGDRGDGGGGRPRVGGHGEGSGGRIGRGSGGNGGDGGRQDRARPASVSGSASGGRDEVSSATSGRGGKVVRLAPAHIAPPSRPAPEWVVHMQKGNTTVPKRKVVLNRPLPFSGIGSTTAAAASGSSGDKPDQRPRRRRRRRSTNGADSNEDDSDGGGGIVRAQAHAMQAFRFLCRSGQLFLAEQLALSGVWDAGKTDGHGSGDGGVGGGDDRIKAGFNAGDVKIIGSSARGGEGAREGLWTAWMVTRLQPAARNGLKERRERVRLALEDVRRFARARGAIFLLPRVGVETAAAASNEWDLRAIPSQREVVREIRSFEKWLARSGVWLAQPLLALLTTCGTAAPRGLKAAAGADGTGADAPGGVAGGGFVAPSEYPTDEVLAEMVDSFEALVCWFYLPDVGRSDSAGGDENGGEGSGGGGGARGGEGAGGRGGYGSEVACFVAYRDEGTRRSGGADGLSKGGERGRDAKRLAGLEAKRAAIAARARGRRRRGEDGGDDGPVNSGSSESGGSDDSGESDNAGPRGSDDELNAEDFEPGALRVRLLLASPGTTQQLRKATGAFLKAIRNRNPVKRDVLSAFALQDLSTALEVPKVLKALPPHVQEITVIQHGLVGIIPVHALPLEEVSSNGEPGRPRSRAMGRPPSAGAAGGGKGGGAGSAAPLAVLDSYSVRYTSSLYLLEIAERAAAAAARDIPWYFNTCCVVEDPLRDVYSEDSSRDQKARRGSSAGVGSDRGEDSAPRGQSAGLLHSRHECRVVGAVWSTDPEECHFCRAESATRQTLTTVVVPSGGTTSNSRRGRGRGQSLGRGRGRGNTVGGSYGTSNGPATAKGGVLGKGTAIATPAEVTAAAAADTARLFATKISQARCLHLCCRAVYYPRPGLVLCRTSFRESKRGGGSSAKRDGNGRKGLSKRLESEHVDAFCLIKQLHLRSCGLVVLSRGGVVDSMRSVEDAETRITAGEEAKRRDLDGDGSADAEEYEPPRRIATPSLGLTEAFMAAGARTVVQKLWYDEETALVDTVTLLCFYEELKEATLAGEKRPVAAALREAQLWLRDATLADILGRVQDAKGLSPDDSDALMKELSSLFKAMSERGNGAAIDRPFSSPYHWAGFQAMGSCGAVQSLQSLEAEDEEDDLDSDNDGDQASRALTGVPTTGREGRKTFDARGGKANSSSSDGSSSDSENDSGSSSSSSSSSSNASSGAQRGGPVVPDGGYAGGKKGGHAKTRVDGGEANGSPARERTGSKSSSGSGASSGSSGSSSSSDSGSSTDGNDSSSSSSSSSSDGAGALHAGVGFSSSGGDHRSRGAKNALEGKDADVINKTLKAVGSAYDMAGRLGGRFKARAAAAAAAAAVPSKPSTRASAPPEAGDAAVAAAAATAGETRMKKPKSPHSWGSSSPGSLSRPTWSRKVTGSDARKTGDEPGPVTAATAGGGNCVMS